MVEEALFSIEYCMFGCGVPAMMAASLVLSAAGMAAQHMGQKKSAKAQDAYQQHLAEMQREAGQRKASAIIARNIQDREETARKTFTVSQQSSAASAESRLVAAAGGVTGLSIEHLLANIDQQEGSYMAALKGEQDLRNRETGRLLKDAHLGTQQQIASTLAPVNYPNALAAGLQFGAKSASIGADYYDWKGKQNDPKLKKDKV